MVLTNHFLSSSSLQTHFDRPSQNHFAAPFAADCAVNAGRRPCLRAFREPCRAPFRCTAAARHRAPPPPRCSSPPHPLTLIRSSSLLLLLRSVGSPLLAAGFASRAKPRLTATSLARLCVHQPPLLGPRDNGAFPSRRCSGPLAPPLSSRVAAAGLLAPPRSLGLRAVADRTRAPPPPLCRLRNLHPPLVGPPPPLLLLGGLPQLALVASTAPP
ncbi:hypothetical protein Scep_024661 [Stephania cephalantha]|uniref:Uncharacterized protein n=1 Tax=Stephania cephalantha TaxID=152367 RepID=A0AAP0EY92_9MAGN